jgi:parallel beta-helix repeat protein
MRGRVQQIVVAVILAGSGVFTAPTATSGSSQSGGQVLHVPRDYPTIQAAADAAAEGDTVHVAAGIYNESVVVSTSGVKMHSSGGVVLDGTGLTGIGIYVRGASAAAPVSGVEVSNFEVRNFERGIIVQWATNVRVHRNEVHDNVDKTSPLALGDGAGMELVTAQFTDVSENVVHHNGEGGIQLRVGSTQNTIRHNRVYENGIQRLADMGGAGILVTGAGTHDNRIEHNEILANYGRGIIVTRPAGMAPITGNLVAHNRIHGNHRSGVAIMFAATGTFVVHNDARANNLSGLAPCYRCNLFDLSFGGNIWEKNLGTFNVTDACAP